MAPGNNSHKEKVAAPVLVKRVTDPCPDCGEQLVHQEGIIECLHCGYQNPSC